MEDIIKLSSDANVGLYVKEGKLGVRAAKAGLPAELKALLSFHKEEIIAYLNKKEKAYPLSSLELVVEKCGLNKVGLSSEQKRLWFIDKFEGGSSQFNLSLRLEFEGAFNFYSVKSALESIVQRHEILRTVYIEEAQEVFQQVKNTSDIDVAFRSLENVKDEQENVVRCIVDQDLNQVFDLQRDTMLRAQVIKLSEVKHILLLTIHHIAFDGWSEKNLIDELSQLYHAYSAGISNSLVPLDIQYRDYAVWQHNWQQSEIFKTHQNFWLEKLENLPQVHSLPLDKKRPVQQSFKGWMHRVTLSNALTQELKALCQARSVTLFMLLQSAFAVLLSRYSNETDIVIGCPVAARTPNNVNHLIGLFLNNLVLRSDVNGEQSFDVFLANNKTEILQAFAHQSVPFDVLVEKLQPERSLSYNPLYQVVFAVQNYQKHESKGSGITSYPYQSNNDTLPIHHELGLHVTEQDDELQLQWSCNLGVFSQQTLKGLAASFEHLLWDVVRAPSTPINQLSLMTELEKQQLTQAQNNTSAFFPGDETLHVLFEKNVDLYPDSIAVIYNEEHLTYSELNYQSNQLAHYLIEQGVGQGTLIGLCVDRSLDMFVGLLGILKAGGAYVPIDPGYPQERIDYLIEDSGIELLLTQRDLMSELDVEDIALIPLDYDIRCRLFAEYSHLNPGSTQNSAQPAYVIYTSGSTGHPKGVLATHKNVSRLVYGSEAYIGKLDSIKVLNASPISFDAATLEIWLPLLKGGTAVCYVHEKIDVELLNTTLNQHKVNVAWLTAGLFDVWVNSAGVENLPLQTIITGGDIVSPQSVKQLYDRHATIQVVNGYGPTECVTFSCCHVIERGFDHSRSLPIGSAVNNTQVYVVSDGETLAPVGAVGELYIGGAGVALGYLNRETLTAERFVKNFFSSVEDNENGYTRLYKTGDLVRWLPNGKLEFIGRKDGQVKIRGFRIEIGEIENMLKQNRLVQDAIVQVNSRNGSENYLVSYVVPTEKAREECSDEELKRACRSYVQSRLPEYMLPSILVLIDSIPLTANGKLDRKRLPEPSAEGVVLAEYVAPQNEVEQILCSVWQTILGVERVGTNDNFFSLGGDSIQSIRIVSKAKEYDLIFTVKDMFKYQSIKMLLENVHIWKVLPNAEETLSFSLLTQTEIERLGSSYTQLYDDVYPMSDLQLGMVYHTELDTEAADYHDVFSYKIKAKWSRPCFEQALMFMLMQHPVLRTGFGLDGERPLQFVHKNVDLSYGYDDIHHQSEAEQDIYIQEWIEQEKRAPFNWLGPLFRVFVHHLNDDTFRLGLSFHHAVYDGWSNSIFISQLFLQYHRLLAGETLPIVKPEYTFREFLKLEASAKQQEVARQFWLKMVEDAPSTQITWKKPRSRLHSEKVTLVKEVEGFFALSESVLDLAVQLGVPVQAVLLAGHSKVLSILSGQNKVLSSTVMNGRPETAGSEYGLGLFLNSLPLCFDIVPGSWRDLIQTTANLLAQSMDYRHYPTSSIQRECDASFSEVLFNYIHFHEMQKVDVHSNLVITESSGFVQTNYDFCVNFARSATEQKVNLEFIYDATIFDGADIFNIGQYYTRVFDVLLTDVDASHLSDSFIAASEKEKLLVDWGTIHTPYSHNKTIHESFEVQVEATPNAIALIFENQTFTYQQLNEKANILANGIRKNYLQFCNNEVEPDTLIGLYLDRSLEMVVAILAVLKAGGAYVPISPQYPQERTKYILADTQAVLVLTHTHYLASIKNIIDANKNVHLLDVNDDLTLSHYSNTNLAQHSRAEHLAYVIYTSGTTGHPKGVMIEHRGVQNLVCNIAKKDRIQPGIKTLFFSSYVFDASVLELFPNLLHGSEIYICTDDEHKNPKLLSEIIEQHQIQTVLLPPVVASYLDKNRIASLNSIIVGGEPPQKGLLEILHSLCAVTNAYGPTETTVVASYHLYQQGDSANNIGKALSNTSCYILDDFNHLVPIGTPGELHIGGAGLARGYLNREVLTLEQFITNPYATEKDKEHGYTRLYKTGDLVRWLPNGDLEFLGRKDTQVKIRGFRIELGEIERALRAYHGIEQAVVVDIEHDTRKQLAAYLVVEEDVSIDALREHLQSQLPDYMVPLSFTVIDTIPLTINGKLNKKALPQAEFSATNQFVAPSNYVERKLCAVWQEVLGLDRVGVLDNFFHIGGDSISAIKLASAIGNALDRKISIRSLIENPTITGFLKALHESHCTASSLPPIIKSRQLDNQAPSFAQKGFWFVDQLNRDYSNQYIVPVCFEITGPLDSRILEQALKQLIERHEVLRTTFFDIDGDVKRLAQDTFEFSLGTLSLHGNLRNTLAEEIRIYNAQPFDLACDLMLRAKLFDCDNNTYVLLINMHHIAVDGWSMGLIFEELGKVYAALIKGRQPELTPLVLHYSDFIVWQQSLEKDGIFQSQFEYWREKLASMPTVHQLPLDKPRPEKQSFAGAYITTALNRALTEKIKEFCRSRQVTLFMFLESAFALLIARYSNTQDVCIGVPVSGRQQTELEAMVGLLTNSLVLRSQLNEEHTFEFFLEENKRTILEAYSNDLIPLQVLADKLHVERNLSHNPLFQIMFTLQNFATGSLELSGVDIATYDTDYNNTRFDIELSAIENANGIALSWIYNIALFQHETIARLSSSYVTLLTGILALPDKPVYELPILSENEKQCILGEWNNTTEAYLEHACVHSIFEQQVQKKPNNIAAQYGKQTITYRELNERANQVAHYIMEQGVSSGELIALYLERSIDMLVSILGIVKSGCAYVPLDHDSPLSRIDTIIHDANVRYILTQTSLHAQCSKLLPNKIVIDSPEIIQCLAQCSVSNIPSDQTSLTSAATIYVVYTSGSTGKPKGVLTCHQNVVSLIADKNFVALTVNDVVAQAANMSFDAMTFEIWSALCSGAKLVGISKEELLDLNVLHNLIRREAIDILFVTTALVNQVAFYQPDCFAPLKYLLFGGEAVNYQAVQTILHSGKPHNLLHVYGPTETTTFSTYSVLEGNYSTNGRVIPIGRPMHNTKLYVTDKWDALVPVGAVGELCISGAGVAGGYLNQPELTDAVFIKNKHTPETGHERLYKTGDLVRWLPDGEIEFVGRVDNQIKVRGFRVELSEIEHHMHACKYVEEAAVILDRHSNLNDVSRLEAFVVFHGAKDNAQQLVAALREYLVKTLPTYMVPEVIHAIDAMPLTPNRKVDKAQLARLSGKKEKKLSGSLSKNALEGQLSAIWCDVLGTNTVGVHENFFDAGGNSLLAIRLQRQIVKELGIEVSVTDIFAYPSIREFAGNISSNVEGDTFEQKAQVEKSNSLSNDIAIIGMSGRFPGASSVAQFWQNMKDGVEIIQNFSDEELRNAGVCEDDLKKENYVKTGVILEDIDLFDAEFFKLTPREAQITDPQQRLLLECAVEALEQAGYGDDRSERNVAVYLGVGESRYLMENIMPNAASMGSLGVMKIANANGRDFAATTISYRLNLTGASINIATGCSTSLVAVHQACTSLLNGESKMALAGGAKLGLLKAEGYLYEDGGIASPDGRCRTFDISANGTRGGSAAGLVLLKRLHNALEDRDPILAVIKGSAVNNDGANKVGFTAPSVKGQVDVIRKAFAVANIQPDTVGYLETHGTGTELGDPIEIAALKKTYSDTTNGAIRCAIGSAKPNVGHCDIAAGVVSLIKTVEALRHKKIPPSIHFNEPKPGLHLEETRFFVNTHCLDWQAKDTPRRAGVSSFGIGGTNAHVILQEAPVVADESLERQEHMLAFSGKTSNALKGNIHKFIEFAQSSTTFSLADAEHTLHTGRSAYDYRTFIVAKNKEDAIAQLTNRFSDEFTPVSKLPTGEPSVVFMFPGQGAQYVDMAKDLYSTEPDFAALLDQCADILVSHLTLDIRQLFMPDNADAHKCASSYLFRTEYAQPILFAVEYSLARTLIGWGIKPSLMIGHSLGEYVAACLSGVFSLEHGLKLVSIRGKLMQNTPSGTMLSVQIEEAAVAPFIHDVNCSIAAINGAKNCVLSGNEKDISLVAERLVAAAVDCQRLAVSHAFHSCHMDGILKEFQQALNEVDFAEMQIPFVSNLTGELITPSYATSSEYWVKHLRCAVQFDKGLTCISNSDAVTGEHKLLLEVGPGKTLSALAKRKQGFNATSVMHSMRHSQDQNTDTQVLLNMLGKLWAAGVPVNWSLYHKGKNAKRIALPTYAFDKKRYWIDGPLFVNQNTTISNEGSKQKTGVFEKAGASTIPKSDLEIQLIRIWQDLLGINNISIHDDFFDLGGDSLLVTRMISLIREITYSGYDFPVREIYKTPTIQHIAESITLKEIDAKAKEVETMLGENAHAIIDGEI